MICNVNLSIKRASMPDAESNNANNQKILFRAVSVQDGMVVLDWKFDDVNGTYNTTHFEVGFLFSFKTMLMMI